jgi:hypothetical protein
VFQTHVSSASSIFRRVLQVLYLDVSKVDKMLHLLLTFCCLVSVSPPPGARWAFEPEAQVTFVAFRVARAPVRVGGAKQSVDADVRALALPLIEATSPVPEGRSKWAESNQITHIISPERSNLLDHG